MKANPQLGRRRSVNIRVQSQTSAQDEFGQPLNAWATICTLQGKIRAASARESFQSGQFTAQNTQVIEAWWTAVSIAPGMRALFGSRVYLIQNVENVEQRNKEILIFCLELNGQTLT